LEHTTLVGFSILVIERDPDAEHYLRRTLDGAGARVFAPRTCGDAICTTDELEVSAAVQVSAAVLDCDESRASRHTVAMRLTDLRIPFVFCADAGQTNAPFIVPTLYRPIVGAELIEMLRRLLQPPLTRAGYRNPSNRLVDPSNEFSGGRGSPAQAPQSTKFSVKET
jgi:hypothetical protein